MNADLGQIGFAVLFDVQAVDNSGDNTTVSCTKESGEEFHIGNTAMTCVAYDAAGNNATCQFLVTVKGKHII